MNDIDENRFSYDKPMVAFSKGGINDNVSGVTYEFTMDTVLDLLNNLNSENKQLRTKMVSFEFLQDENRHMREVLNENRILRKLLLQFYTEDEIEAELI